MREIKFRVWNVISKKMLGWGAIFDLPAWEIFPGTPEQRPYNVMQSTGLKDKNGKEIYEGDIVQLLDLKPYEIAWNDMNAQFSLRRGSYEALEMNDDLHAYEVIGNIYENGDLISE